MKFSILMSVYKGDSPIFLGEALESLYSQTLLPEELIVVIDGPIDSKLKKILDYYSQKKELSLKQVPLEQNCGLGLALAKGLMHCKNNIVARMDSDDICKPDRFEIQIAFLKKNPEVSVLGSWIDEFIGKKSNVLSQRKVPRHHEDIMKYMKARCPFNHPTVVFKKDVILAAGNYKPFFLKEDIYLWLRLAKKGGTFANVPKSLLYFRTTKDMFKRRGGWKYAISEFKILRYRQRIGMITYGEFVAYNFLTIPVRLAPNWVRGLIYNNLLR